MTLDTSLVHRLSDSELLASTRRLVADGRAVTADLLVLLGEVEARRLHLGHACSSLFAFCTDELGFSEDAAYTRITVARLARRLPAVLDTVRSGRVHLTGLRLLAPHLNEDNHAALLAEAAGMSKREVEVLVARIAPKPPVPAFIRKLPAPRQAELTATATTSVGAHITVGASEPPSAPQPSSGPSGNPLADAPRSTPGAVLAAASMQCASSDASGSRAGTAPAPASGPSTQSAAHRPLIQPLAEDAYRVQFTASRGLRDKLREAQDLLRHQLPEVDLATLMERAVDLLLADVKKKRFGLGRKPRTMAADVEVHDASSRHVPDAIKRAVYERDGSRCAFVDERGHRCEETAGLEFDHLDGFARTRAHTVDRIRLACRAHNQHAADTLYGRDFMEAKRAYATRSGTGDNTPHSPRCGSAPRASFRDESIRDATPPRA